MTTSDGDKLAYAVSGSGIRIAQDRELAQSTWSPTGKARYGPTGSIFCQPTTPVSLRHPRQRLSPTGPTTEVSFEHQVTDLEQIADAARLEQFALLGLSQERLGPLNTPCATRSASATSSSMAALRAAGRSAVRRPSAQDARWRGDGARRLGAGARAPTAACSPSCSSRSRPKSRWRGSASCSAARRRREIAARDHGGLRKYRRGTSAGTGHGAHAGHAFARRCRSSRSNRVASSPPASPMHASSSSTAPITSLLENEPAWQKFQGSRRRVPRLAPPGATAPRSLIRRPHPKNWRCSRRVSARSSTWWPAVPTTQAIAERLFISEKTVRNHLTAIFDKTWRELAFRRPSCSRGIGACAGRAH